MRVDIAPTYEEMSRRTADSIIDIVNKTPDALLSLAGGSTPLGTFSALIQAARQNRVDFSQCRFVSLDEWVGLSDEEEGSCKSTLYKHLFEPLHIREDQIRFFNGRSDDLALECSAMDRFIQAYGPIDIMLLGVGLNGHLGFNEPGCDRDAYSHVVELDSVTKNVSIKYFSEKKDLNHGITLGMKHIMESSKVLLVADGEKKAAIIEETLYGAVDNRVPSSLLRMHPDVSVFLDQKAASNVKENRK